MTRATTACRSLIALVAIIASFALAAPVGAAPPDINRWVETYEFVAPASDNPCGVDILVVGEATGADKFFYDRNGNLTKISIHVNNAWTETGLPSGGTVNGSTAFTHTETNFQENPDGSFAFTVQEVGIPIKLQAPGLGVISVDAGNLGFVLTFPADGSDPHVELLWEHGQHPLFFLSPDASDEWIADYCAVITG